MSFIDRAKEKVDDLVGTVKRDVAANDEKAEADTEADPHVAGSRAGGKDGDDGEYVGRTFADDDTDVGETGAEARSEADRTGS